MQKNLSLETQLTILKGDKSLKNNSSLLDNIWYTQVSNILAIAMIARLWPRRFLIASYLSLKYSLSLSLIALLAHWTSSGLIPALEILTDIFLPELSLFWGVRPAHEQRCLSSTKMFILLPISESM